MGLKTGDIVLVTRPEPGASRTAAALGAIGLEPVICPLTGITPVAANFDADDFRDIEVFAVTSANALRHLPDDLIKLMHGKPVHVVGDATGALARSLGLKDVWVAGGDAAALGQQLCGATGREQCIGYLAGQERTGTLEAHLQAGGRKFKIFETYQTQKVSCMTYKNMFLASDRLPSSITVHSGLALEVIIECASAEDFRYHYENIDIFLISERLRQHVPDGVFHAVHVASNPTDAAMIAGIEAFMQK